MGQLLCATLPISTSIVIAALNTIHLITMARLIFTLLLASGYISSLIAGVPTDNALESLSTRDSIEERTLYACDSWTRCCEKVSGDSGSCFCHEAGWPEYAGVVCCKIVSHYKQARERLVYIADSLREERI